MHCPLAVLLVSKPVSDDYRDQHSPFCWNGSGGQATERSVRMHISSQITRPLTAAMDILYTDAKENVHQHTHQAVASQSKSFELPSCCRGLSKCSSNLITISTQAGQHLVCSCVECATQEKTSSGQSNDPITSLRYRILFTKATSPSSRWHLAGFEGQLSSSFVR